MTFQRSGCCCFGPCTFHSADRTACSTTKGCKVCQGKSAVRLYQYTPGVRKRFWCLFSRAWFWGFPLQKFCRKVCARVMISFIFSSLCAKAEPKQFRERLVESQKPCHTNTSQKHQVQQVIQLPVLVVTDLLIGDLQQVQHDSMGPHVLQQPLLLHTTLFTGITQLTEPL